MSKLFQIEEGKTFFEQHTIVSDELHRSIRFATCLKPYSRLNFKRPKQGTGYIQNAPQTIKRATFESSKFSLKPIYPGS